METIKPGWDLNLASLAGSFDRYFYFGNIYSNQTKMTSYNTMDAYLHHFNAVTAENDHKVASIANIRGMWNFNTADRIVEWAEENNLAMIGHNLVWHSQSPVWLTTHAGSEEPLSRSEAIENMELYISTVAGRYAGRIYSWDVLNEALLDINESEWRQNPDWRAHMRSAGRGLEAANKSQWYNAFANGSVGDEGGSDYVYYAYRFARIYDPFAILYYNDYNDHVPGKRDAIAQMVTDINKQWESDRLYDGRLLIEGIGMQGHYNLFGWMTELFHVRNALELYSQTGARISITEWDILMGGSAANPIEPTPGLLEAQAARYRELAGYYLEYSAFIERVTLWGKADHQSWRAWANPLLFDSSFNAKPAYFALLEAVNNAEPPNISLPAISTEKISGAVLGEYYAFKMTALQNNYAPILWSLRSGSLPPGLRLIGRTGVILGTPDARGSFTFSLEAANATGSSSREFTLIVQ